jgi:hypothetical protein
MDDITPEMKEVLPDHFIINSMMNTKHKRFDTYSIPSSNRRSSTNESGRGRGRGSRTTSGRGRATNKLGGFIKTKRRSTKRRSTRKRR